MVEGRLDTCWASVHLLKRYTLTAYQGDVWGDGKAFKRSEIAESVLRLSQEPDLFAGKTPHCLTVKPSRQYHIDRIAWLVVHGWKDPISLEMQDGWIEVNDGNHRLAAAVYRRDRLILITWAGYEDMLSKVLLKRKSISGVIK